MTLSTVDPLEYVRRRPERFFRSGKATGLELAQAIAGDALLLTGGPVALQRAGEWWLIAAEDDWMENTEGRTVQELFAHIVPLAQAGPNSMRGEVLTSAFATDVLTACDGCTQIIKGTVCPEGEVLQTIRAKPGWKRVVAFRLHEGEKSP